MPTDDTHFIEVNITDFSKEGYGIGKITNDYGKVTSIGVPFACPGDLVRVQFNKRRCKWRYHKNAVELITPAKERVIPRCVHFGSCGGCRWQHVAYEEQLRQKEHIIRQHLAPYLHAEVEWHAIIPCEPPWNYRNKMELSFSSDKAGNRYLGLILQGTRGHVFQMTECHLCHPWMIDAVNAVSKWWESAGIDAYHMMSDRGTLRTLTLRYGEKTSDRLVMLTVSSNPDYALQAHVLHAFIATVRAALEQNDVNCKLSIVLRIQQIAKGEPTQFYEMILHGPDHIRETLYLDAIGDTAPKQLNLHISPTAFLQPNTRQAERLYSRVMHLSQANKEAIVFDLYCGTGTLGLCFAPYVKNVIGIELMPQSVLDARENIALNHFSNMSIYEGDVGTVLSTLASQRPDIVLVDPPRAGLDAKAIRHLMALKAPTLVYISCNPATQAANLADIIGAGYKLQAVQPVDQFPHTIHVENIVLLKYNSEVKDL